MRLVRGLERLKPLAGRNAVSIGVFDGVHRGHQSTLDRLTSEARALGGLAVVLTFDPHPAAVRSSDGPPPVLTALRTKAELVAAAGVDLLVVARFDERLRQLSPATFAREILAAQLSAACVVVGEGFRFGRKASGDVAALGRLGKSLGLTVVEVPLLTWRGRPISSTRIRDLLSRGEIDEATRILGHHPMLTGRVVAGHRRGSGLLGFPTANLSTHEEAGVPRAGVYAGRACVRHRTFDCVIDIGTSPTFGPGEPTSIHVHIPGLDENLYASTMDVEILARLRDEKAFGGPEDLVRQIKRDLRAAGRVWRTAEPAPATRR